MNKTQVKEIMIPILNYVTVQKENTLVEVLQSLEQARKSENDMPIETQLWLMQTVFL